MRTRICFSTARLLLSDPSVHKNLAAGLITVSFVCLKNRTGGKQVLSLLQNVRFFKTTASACQFHYQGFCAAYDEYLIIQSHYTRTQTHTHSTTITHTHTQADSIILDFSSARHSISSPPVLLFREKRADHCTRRYARPQHIVLLREQEFLLGSQSCSFEEIVVKHYHRTGTSTMFLSEECNEAWAQSRNSTMFLLRRMYSEAWSQNSNLHHGPHKKIVVKLELWAEPEPCYSWG